MRTERYRYVVWKNKEGAVIARELYDHQVDPAENQNLALRPESKSVLSALEAQFQAGWRGALPVSRP